MHSGEDVDFRSYRHIYTNANQKAPKDNIRLGFKSRYRDEIFEVGEYNNFHFPLVPRDFEYKDDIRFTSGLPINESGLTEDGSVCGYAPYCSDRVYMNNVDYEWKDSGGGAVPRKLNNGVWLCAWLSGDLVNPSGAMWMDRWYDPVIITKHEALRHRETPGVIDCPSRLAFKYGCQYKYYRVSKKDISEVVNDCDKEGIVLNINDWSDSGCINSVTRTSATPITNVGYTEGLFSACEVVRGSGDYGIRFNGKSCVQVDSDALNDTTEGNFSVVAFVRHDDWKNSNGCAIIDRGFHGGWEVGAYPYPHNDLICVLGEEKQTGRETIGIYGPAFDLVSVSKLPEGKHIYNAVVDDEYYIWALRETDIVKIDLNGNITYSIPLPKRILDNPQDMSKTHMQLLGGDYYGNVAVAIIGEPNDNTDEELPYLDFFTIDTVASRVNPEYDGREHQTIITGVKNLNRAVNNKTSWLEIEGGKYKDFATRIRTWDEPDELTGDPLLQLDDGEIPIDIKVDADYNIFVLTKLYRTLEDLDGNSYVEKDEETGEYKGEYGSRLLRFIKDLDGSFYRKNVIDLEWSQYGKPMGILVSAYGKNGEHRTLVNMVMDNGEVVRYNQNLVKMWTTNISYRSNNITEIMNGYEWGRRFMNNVLYARITLSDKSELLVENNGKKHLLTYPLENVSDYDWHQISFIRSPGSIRLTFDCRTVAEEKLGDEESAWKVSSVSDPAIVLGGEVGVGAALCKEHELAGLFWDGMMDDFRLYNIALSNQDLCYLHMAKYDIYPLYWNMEIYDKYHIEAIRRFYKMKMPGSKSQNYDVVVNGFAKDEDETGEFSLLKSDLKRMIGDSLPKISPTYAQNREVIFNGKNTVAKWK